MAIFDSNKKMYLTFYIALTDPDLVAQYKTQYTAANPLNQAPYNPGPPPSGAAVTFNAPWRGYTQPAAGSAPFSWTPWSGEGEQDGPYPLNVPSFERHTGGFLGIGGTTVKYYWIGEFVLAVDDGDTTADGIEITAIIPARKFIDGFEYPNAGIGTLGNTSGVYCSPDAARSVGGFGLALRGATAQYTGTWAQYGAAATPKGWERFYIRLRQLPSAATFFWNTSTSPSSSVGTLLAVTASGQLALYTSDSGGNKTLVQSIDQAVLDVWDGDPNTDSWHRIDIIQNTSGTPYFALWFDGRLRVGTAVPPTISGTAGAVNATSITSSKFGPADATANDLYLDVDDWMVADIPTNIVTPTDIDLNSRDFINGSKIVRVCPLAFGATHGAWTGAIQVARQNVGGVSVSTPPDLVSTTALAQAVVTTDAELSCEADPGSVGVAAIQVNMHSKRGTNSGKLGYSLAGGAKVLTSVTQGVVNSVQGVMWTGPAAKNFVDITPLELCHEKGNDAVSGSLYGIGAQAELIGKFTTADWRLEELLSLGAVTPSFYGNTGAHNRPYPRSPWSILGQAAPIAPYLIKMGTYVGNDTGQDLTFRAPVNMFFTRPLTGNLGGYMMFSSDLGAHRGNIQGLTSQVALEEDPTFNGAPGSDSQTLQYRVRLAGNNSQINATGVTYQYLAIMDPGMRFMLNLHVNHKSTFGPRIWRLVNPDFTPQWAFLQGGDYSATSTSRLYAKSSGQAAASIVNSSPAVVTNALTFGGGQITTDANLHAITPANQAISLWRRDDGSQDTGIPAAVCFGTYTGDGSGTRTISLAPATGKRPIFCWLFGESGANSRYRDPSHTGTNSSINGGGDSATGITAGGIDQFTVATGMNTNGVVYSYFVIFGDATACNNGWGCNGEYGPVEPTSVPGGGQPEDPTEPGTVVIPPPDEEGPTPDPDDPSPDFDADCIVATTAIVNRALHRIGISKRISDVGTDLGIEASVARTNWGLDVNKVLRDHPWSFATRYADLVLVAGTADVPVNKDWQYAYRAPTDMLFARRIVGQGDQRRAWDRDPIDFRLGSDSVGALIYTDAAIEGDTPVQLEYTIRINCPASRGDATFRDALIWRHAASIAAPLTRDLKKMQWAQAMYEQVIRDAKTHDSQEQQQAPEGDTDWIAGRG